MELAEAEDSFTLIPGSEVTKYEINTILRFSTRTRKKVMKDFAKKKTAEHVRLSLS